MSTTARVMYTLRLTSSFLRVAVQDDAEFVAMAEVLEYRGRRWRNGRGPLTDRLRQSRANWRIIALRDGSASARSLTSGEGGRISSPHGKLMRRQPREPNMKFMILVKSNPDLEARLAAMTLPWGLTDASVGGHPIGFPGLTVIVRKGLLEADRCWRDVRDDEAY